jgi:hypothetical protein
VTDRKAFIASLASAAALAACSNNAALPGSSALGPALSPLGKRRNSAQRLAVSLKNETGVHQDRDVYFLLYGQGLPPDNDWYHLTDPQTGAIEKCVSTDLKYTADYTFKLSEVSTLMLPPMRAARLYFSFEKKLLLQVNNDGIPSPPIGFDSTAQNVNYNTIFDFVEWTLFYPSDQGWNGNLTLVDSVNIPIDYHIVGQSLTGEKLDYKRGFVPGGYSKFLASMKAQPDFAGLVLPGLNRVLAPNIGLEPFAGVNGPVFKADYYDSYIDDVWTKYSTEKITIVTNQGATWHGAVKNGQLVFSPVSGQTDLEPIALKKPTTKEIFACADICVSGCKSSTNPLQENLNNQIRGAFLSAMNRSTLLTDTTIGVNPASAYCKDPSKFYQGPKTNFYAKYIHENSEQNLAYTFGIDDYCDQSSYVAVAKPTSFEITLAKQ